MNARALALVLVGCASTGLPDARLERAHLGQGWALMVSPIEAPMSADARQRITVWLRLPDGRSLGPDLTYPPGSAAKRVEARFENDRWKPLDVRGVEYRPEQHMFVLRPDARSGDLVGFEWTRGDVSARTRAMRSLEHVVAREGYEPVSSFCGNQDCGGCHVREKAASAVVGPLPPLSTDGGGLYRVRTVLEDDAPLLESRAHDPNLLCAYVALGCDASDVSITRDDEGAQTARCSDGVHVPYARFDMKRALAASDAHALEVCASRRYLRDHMTDRAREVFAAAFDECSLF